MIDDYAQSNDKERKPTKIVNDDFRNKEKEFAEEEMNEIEIHSSEKKKPGKSKTTHNNSKPLAKGQTTLTGMFGVSVNK